MLCARESALSWFSPINVKCLLSSHVYCVYILISTAARNLFLSALAILGGYRKPSAYKTSVGHVLPHQSLSQQRSSLYNSECVLYMSVFLYTFSHIVGLSSVAAPLMDRHVCSTFPTTLLEACHQQQSHGFASDYGCLIQTAASEYSTAQHIGNRKTAGSE